MGFHKHAGNNDSNVVRFVQCPKCKNEGRDTSGDNLAIYSDGHAWCFGGHGYFHPNNVSAPNYALGGESCSPKKHNERIGSVEYFRPKRGNPEDETERKITEDPRSWLQKYGITEKDLLTYDIQIGEDTVTFSLKKGDSVCYRNIRNFRKGADKYTSKRLIPGTLWDPLRSSKTKDDSPLVIVEDVVSAIKVSKAGYKALPLCGSGINVKALKRAVDESGAQEATRIWLDPDKRLESLKMASRLNQWEGYGVTLVFSGRDPKDYSEEAIKELLK